MAYRYLCAAELLQYAELLAGLPAFISAPEGIRARGADLISATQPLLPAESARRGDGEVDLLQIDREADLAWAALYHVGHGLTRLPSSDPIGFAARTFQQAVFPNKLHFTRFTMQKQFAHAERLLALIDERGLAVALKPAGFDHLMQNVRRSHARYASGLAACKTAPAMSEPLRTVRRSLDAFVDLVEVSTGRELGEDDAHAMLEPLAHAELQAIRRRHALGIWPAVTPLSPMLQDA